MVSDAAIEQKAAAGRGSFNGTFFVNCPAFSDTEVEIMEKQYLIIKNMGLSVNLI